MTYLKSKKINTILSAVAIVTILTSAGFVYGWQKIVATAEQQEDVYLFISSKPVAEYEYVGTVKSAGMIKNYNQEYLIGHMLKRVKKKCRKQRR